jgi:hypothetical protein
MPCYDRFGLVLKYYSECGAYSKAVTALNNAQTSAQSEYMQLWHAAEDAHLSCKATQRAIECHIRTHGCGIEGYFITVRGF